MLIPISSLLFHTVGDGACYSKHGESLRSHCSAAPTVQSASMTLSYPASTDCYIHLAPFALCEVLQRYICYELSWTPVEQGTKKLGMRAEVLLSLRAISS